jgi:hypothetical protein
MPTYFEGSLAGLISNAGLTNPYSLPSSLNPSLGSTACCSNAGNCCCPSSTKFLETLTDKLIEMTKSLKEQFAELVRPPSSTTSRGIRLAEVDVTQFVQTRYEYIFYIRRYGPPTNGIFDPVYLDLIRAEIEAGVIDVSTL